MSRRLKKHQAEITDGPHHDDGAEQLPDDDGGEIRSTGLWTKETKLSLAVLVLLLAGLGAAFYFRLSPESVGTDPFALLRSDVPEETAEADGAAVVEEFGLAPPVEVEEAGASSFPVVSESNNATYGGAQQYQPPDPWQAATPASEPSSYSQDNGSFTQQASNLAEQAAESFAEQGQQALDGFDQQAEELAQQATDSFGQQAQETSDAMVGQFQEATDTVQDHVDSFSQQVSDAIPQDVQQDLGSLADQAQQAVEDYSGQAGDALNELVQQAPEAVDSAVSQAQEFVGDQMQQAEQFTQQATDGLQDSVQDMVQSANPFPAAEAPPEQSPLSAFEPAPAPTAADSYQQPGVASTSEPSVRIAEPPAEMETATPRTASPAAPIESQATVPDYSGSYSQPVATTPSSRRRSPDAFGQPPERFDASAFEPPTEQAPPTTPQAQTAAPSVARTSPAPAPMTPSTRAPETNTAVNSQPIGQAPTSPSPTGNFSRNQSTYTVQANDNYWRISEKLYGNGAYFKALFEHNRDRFPRANRLKVGDVIQAPPAEVLQQTYPKLCPHPGRPTSSIGGSTGSLVASRRAIGSGRTYVVQEGDTLYDIARYELGEAQRWYEIRQLNRDILGDDAKSLRPGIELVLPTSEVASRTPSSINR